MRALQFVLALVSTVFVAACGDKPNPLAPGPSASSSVASLVITGDDYVLTGSTTAYSATATLSDGFTRTVTPVWSSSAADVATVDNTGRLEGRTHGSTTLTAAYEGRRTSKTVQVVNNYGGNWSGRYVIRVCRDSGIFRDGIYGGSLSDVAWCQAHNGVGSVHSAVFTLSQTGNDYSQIRLTFGNPEYGEIRGVVTADGRLNVGGTSLVLDWYGEPWGHLEISNWDTNFDPSGAMVGRWTQNLTMFGRQGHAYEEVELVAMARTPSSPASR